MRATSSRSTKCFATPSYIALSTRYIHPTGDPSKLAQSPAPPRRGLPAAHYSRAIVGGGDRGLCSMPLSHRPSDASVFGAGLCPRARSVKPWAPPLASQPMMSTACWPATAEMGLAPPSSPSTRPNHERVPSPPTQLGPGLWGRPTHGRASTHILKVESRRHPGMAQAEADCLHLARAVVLTTVDAVVENMVVSRSTQPDPCDSPTPLGRMSPSSESPKSSRASWPSRAAHPGHRTVVAVAAFNSIDRPRCH